MVLTQPPNESQGRLGGHDFLGLPEILGRVHGQPEPRVAERLHASLAGELRKGRVLVIAALRQAVERLLPEDVDAAADPVRELRRLPKAGDDIVVPEVDDPERRLQRRYCDSRRGTGLAVASV